MLIAVSTPIIERGAAVQKAYAFVCAHCGLHADASVDTADDTEARALVAIAACPKCGERNDEAVRPILRARIVPSLMYGFLYGLAAIAGTSVVRQRADSLDVAAGSVVAAVFAIGNFVVPVQRRLAETRRVRMRSDEAT
jgi:hypothetical protein